MNDYRSDVPRAAFALGAAAMTALTLATFVVAPATFEPGRASQVMLAANAAPVEVAISPARIDVIGVREPNVAWALPEGSKPCRPAV